MKVRLSEKLVHKLVNEEKIKEVLKIWNNDPIYINVTDGSYIILQHKNQNILNQLQESEQYISSEIKWKNEGLSDEEEIGHIKKFYQPYIEFMLKDSKSTIKMNWNGEVPIICSSNLEKGNVIVIKSLRTYCIALANNLKDNEIDIFIQRFFIVEKEWKDQMENALQNISKEHEAMHRMQLQLQKEICIAVQNLADLNSKQYIENVRNVYNKYLSLGSEKIPTEKQWQYLEYKAGYIYYMPNKGRVINTKNLPIGISKNLLDINELKDIDPFSKGVKEALYTSASSNTERGNTLYSYCEYNAALKMFNKAIALDSSYIDAYQGKALTLCQLDDLTGAVETYQAALTISPDNEVIQNQTQILINKLSDRKQLQTITEQCTHTVEYSNKKECEVEEEQKIDEEENSQVIVEQSNIFSQNLYLQNASQLIVNQSSKMEEETEEEEEWQPSGMNQQKQQKLLAVHESEFSLVILNHSEILKQFSYKHGSSSANKLIDLCHELGNENLLELEELLYSKADLATSQVEDVQFSDPEVQINLAPLELLMGLDSNLN